MRACIIKERPASTGVSMPETTPSPFTLYREGYIDGYEGRDPTSPNESQYMMGYKDGATDDVHDSPARFSRDTS